MRRASVVAMILCVPLFLIAAEAIGNEPAERLTSSISGTPAFSAPHQDAPAELHDTQVIEELRRLRAELDSLKKSAGATLISEPSNSDLTTGTPTPSTDSLRFPTTQLTGFFHADSVWISQETANRLAVGNGVAADGDAQDGADFRRARLAATGKAWDNVTYMLEVDFAFPGRPSFMDVWLEAEEIARDTQLRIGHYRAPFGMDAMTSVRELTFLERALPSALVPFRQIGAMLHGHGADELTTWAIAGFRFPTDPFGGNVGDNGGFGFATRLTAILARPAEDRLLHIGGGYSFIDPANDLVQYRNQPEVFVGETGGAALVPEGVPNNLPFFVDTGLLPTNHTQLFNAELAAVADSAHLQGEALFAVVTEPTGEQRVFPGVYLQAGYFLTGESRSYNTSSGVLGGINPNRCVGRAGGLGAWEIAGRWSSLDLNDGSIQGGRLNNLTAGLNWYWNPATKFQFNYIHSILDKSGFGQTAADLFAFRAQLSF